MSKRTTPLLSLTITWVLPVFLAALITSSLLAGCTNPRHDEVTRQARYTITLYEQGEVVDTWHANSWSNSVFSLSFTVPGDNRYHELCGTYVLEPEGSPTQTSPGGANYIAKLYSGGKAVRSWFITSYEHGDNAVYIRPTGTKEDTRVSGTYTVIPIN